MSHASSSFGKRHNSQHTGGGEDMSSDHHSLHHHHHHHHMCDPEWEAKEELRLRELEEARARATQMEKTMRWWSDCTANWREKWSKVRTERNKAREETRLLRGKLELSTKECNILKREREDLLLEVTRLRKDFNMLSNEPSIEKQELNFSTLQSGERVIAERDMGLAEKPSDPEGSPTLDPFNNNNRTSSVNLCKSELNLSSHNQDLEFLDKLFYPKGSSTGSCHDFPLGVPSGGLSPMGEGKKLPGTTSSSKLVLEEGSLPELVEQKVSMLQLRLDQTVKTIHAERQEKNKLVKNMEKIQVEMNQLRAKYEDLKKTKNETQKELNQMKSDHQDELDSIRLDLEDEANSRSSLDQRLAELRAELEHRQAENAAEWGRRERLETEKLNLERENKKLRTQLEDLEERLERKTKQMTTASDLDGKTLQMELHDKNKELADLKYAHGKLKKVLQDKLTELAHAVRRSEQYESEVKKLRSRIEELKKELAAAEDEVDSTTNSFRKLQRTNDELQEQVEGLQMQVHHLQSRLRVPVNHILLSRHHSSSNPRIPGEHLIEDDSAEF